MSATIIDSLVVLFGLDPTGYTKGADEVARAQAALDAKRKRGVVNTDKEEKDLAAARKKRSAEVSKASKEVSQSFKDVGLTIAGLFLGFESATGFVKFLAGLNTGEAQLGRTAVKLGMGVHELNKWGNAVQFAGGKSEDAQEAFSKIATEFNTSRVTGQIGPLLAFLRARGVAVADANGKMRNQGVILEELADKTAQYGAVYQANMFRQAGLNEGEINYLIQARNIREEQLRLAEKNNGVTDESVRKAQQVQQAWVQVKEQITAAGQRVLEDLTPAILATLNAVSQIVEKLAGWTKKSDDWFAGLEAKKQKAKTDGNTYAFGTEWRSPGKAIEETNAKWEKEHPAAPASANQPGIMSQLGTGFMDAIRYANGQASRSVDPVQKQQLLATIAATETQLGIPAGLLARIAEQESHFRQDIISGKTKSSAGATGLMQLMPKYFPGAEHMTPEQQIAVAGKELSRLYKVFGDWNKAIAAYNDGEGNIKKVLAGKKILPEETRKYVAAVGATPGISSGRLAANGNGGTNITVDADITVTSSNADPAAVANETAGALTRKLSAAQAFQGQS